MTNDAQIETVGIAVYRRIQETAWAGVAQAVKTGRSPARLLSEIRQAQREIDEHERAGAPGAGDAAAVIQRLKESVIQVITATSPELAPVVAQALLEALDPPSADTAPSQGEAR